MRENRLSGLMRGGSWRSSASAYSTKPPGQSGTRPPVLKPAAPDAPAEPSRRLHPPAGEAAGNEALRLPRRARRGERGERPPSGKSAVGPGGRRARQGMPRERGGEWPRRRPRSLALTSRRPPWSAPALRSAHRAAANASTAAGPAGRRARSLPLGPRLRSRWSLQGGRRAPRSPGPRARPEGSGRWAARGPDRPLRSTPHPSLRSARPPARTPPASLRLDGCAPAVADPSGVKAALLSTRAVTYGSRSAFRSFVATLRARAAARLCLALRRA